MVKKFHHLDLLKKIEQHRSLQYLFGLGSIFFISLVCNLFVGVIGYHGVALILLLTVSLLAMFLDSLPILVVAITSALIWNFLFIQPQATLSIHTPQDALLFLMYFVIVVMNAVFTSRIRKMESLARERKTREKHLQLYNTLLNSLSHELKTPISMVLGAVETLSSNPERLTRENREELLAEIEIAGKRLHRQVNNLLSMSRLESQFMKLQLDWYDINEIIHSLIQVNQKDGETHQILFEADEKLPLFRLDGVLVEQILQNLLQNALQYSPPGSEVMIRAVFSDGLQVEISDQGPGIPEERQEQVFEKFYRLPNTSAGGTGLGLSIAKGFAKAHNGDIYLENLPGRGAKFTVSIPAETSFLNTFENE